GITFAEDIRIIFKTVGKAFKKEGITQDNMATAADYGDYLLSEDKVNREEYDRKQREAKEYIMNKAG
ncbi:MAG: sugar transferase, partial [Oscillospiraceae bacterium]|nr:sugar transferase [Oscillospiraceae bacterium]